MKQDRLSRLLGTTVTVEIDRPIGYAHGNITYCVNYGYLPGVPAGDGEEQDAYVLGVEKPLERFSGRVIAVIRRADDVEDKLVVASEGAVYTPEQIRHAVWFVERYFDSSVQTMWEEENER